MTEYGFTIDGIKYKEMTTLGDDRPVIRPLLIVEPKELIPAITNLHGQGLTHLSTIIGLQENSHLSLLYPLSKPVQFAHSPLARPMIVKTQVGLDDPKIDTIMDIMPVADLYERELTDLLGISFGEKGTDRFLLPDDFPEGMYPLRKEFNSKELQDKLTEMGVGSATAPADFKGLGSYSPPPLNNVSDRYTVTSVKSDADYSLSIGPQHPTHKEPIRFQFYVKGENIEDVSLRIGFNHRGIEKALEMNTWLQNQYLIERICGICSAAHQSAYVLTAEKIAGIIYEVPDRANYIRVLIQELERIHSHILWYGVLAHDSGYDMMFHITWRDREDVMDLLEKISGNRVNYSMFKIGGVTRDISEEIRIEGIELLKKIKKKVIQHKEVMVEEKTFVARMKDVGILSKEEAVNLCAVGPTQRGSNIDYDLRRDAAYPGYDEIPFKVHYQTDGDVLASMIVRLDETIESVDMCIYALENLPKGGIETDVPKQFPAGEALTRVEAPRGEDLHYIKSTGGKGPDRHKIRAPTLSNIYSLLHRFKSMQIADIPMIIRLIDPCIGCMERVTFVDIDTNKTKTITGQELISKSNRKYRLDKDIRLFW